MEPYRQAVPAIGLSLERNTGRVPGDGYYYVLFNGEVKGRYRSLRQAQAQYKQLFANSGWTPDPTEAASVDVATETVERYMNELEDYWSNAHKHARRGGKTMYRS
ncbi:MAG: hypothetical protein A2148_06835 [Chloroflexi bacterium RBG_16_68_14]|nr:MAG: hypothetical protein A2148_06835 [Chloroflexi bacterium RBG_16_68_14]